MSLDYITIGRLIYNVLDSIAPIRTSMYSMIATNDIYNHPPFLRFRFKELKKNDDIYKKLGKIIEDFKGNLRWKLCDNLTNNNYIIMPSFLGTIDEVNFLYKKEYFISVIGEKSYQDKIINALEDIPELTLKIQNSTLK